MLVPLVRSTFSRPTSRAAAPCQMRRRASASDPARRSGTWPTFEPDLASPQLIYLGRAEVWLIVPMLEQR